MPRCNREHEIRRKGYSRKGVTLIGDHETPSEPLHSMSERYLVPDEVRTHYRLPRMIAVICIVLWIFSVVIASPILRTLSEPPPRRIIIDLERFREIPGLTLISERTHVNR